MKQDTTSTCTIDEEDDITNIERVQKCSATSADTFGECLKDNDGKYYNDMCKAWESCASWEKHTITVDPDTKEETKTSTELAGCILSKYCGVTAHYTTASGAHEDT